MTVYLPVTQSIRNHLLLGFLLRSTHDPLDLISSVRQTVAEVISPFGTPYYEVSKLSEEEAWDVYHAHALDGVWLDFIRWPCHWEVPEPALPRTSFDAATVARFARDAGIDLPAVLYACWRITTRFA